MWTVHLDTGATMLLRPASMIPWATAPQGSLAHDAARHAVLDAAPDADGHALGAPPPAAAPASTRNDGSPTVGDWDPWDAILSDLGAHCPNTHHVSAAVTRAHGAHTSASSGMPLDAGETSAEPLPGGPR